MLTYLLALVVGLGSFSLYMAAFLFPEVHRRYDFIWSGVGMFYALVLWVCAGRITGGLLLGQIASVALLSWFVYQTLHLRREQTPVELRTPLPASANTPWEVMQVTVQQLRSSFRQSADRSPLAARLERNLTQLEEFWQAVQRQINALKNTSFNSTAANPESPEPAKKVELYAEWDDLETDTDPDLETVEGSLPYPSFDRRVDSTQNSASQEVPPA
jgi:hypothetical protein